MKYFKKYGSPDPPQPTNNNNNCFTLAPNQKIYPKSTFIGCDLIFPLINRAKKRRYIYRKIFSSSNSLDTFNVDLFVTSPKFLKKGHHLYSLFAVDTISRYIFYQNISLKNSNTVVEAFKKILRRIRSLKNKQLFGIASCNFITFIR